MKNNRCNNRRGCGCGCMKMARGYWNNFPYYTGPCPNGDGCYPCDQDEDNDNTDRCDSDCGCECRERRCHRHDRCGRRGRGDRCGRWGRCSGMFTAWLPVAISPNGIVPLTVYNPCRESSFEVNSGLITLERAGTYLATYTVPAPDTAALDTTITLNVDGASQSTAATRVLTAAGDTTTSFTGQAIFQADDGATVSLRTSEAINVTDPAAQPMFTLSLVQLDE